MSGEWKSMQARESNTTNTQVREIDLKRMLLGHADQKEINLLKQLLKQNKQNSDHFIFKFRAGETYLIEGVLKNTPVKLSHSLLCRKSKKTDELRYEIYLENREGVSTARTNIYRCLGVIGFNNDEMYVKEYKYEKKSKKRKFIKKRLIREIINLTREEAEEFLKTYYEILKWLGKAGIKEPILLPYSKNTFTLYEVMRDCGPSDLSSYTHPNHHRFTEGQKLKVMTKIAEAIFYDVADQDLIHGDLKDSNIVVLEQGNPHFIKETKDTKTEKNEEETTEEATKTDKEELDEHDETVISITDWDGVKPKSYQGEECLFLPEMHMSQDELKELKKLVNTEERREFIKKMLDQSGTENVVNYGYFINESVKENETHRSLIFIGKTANFIIEQPLTDDGYKKIMDVVHRNLTFPRPACRSLYPKEIFKIVQIALDGDEEFENKAGSLLIFYPATEAYAAPETTMVRGNAVLPLTQNSDVFSEAIILMRFYTGHDINKGNIHDEIALLKESPLKTLFMKMTDLDPDKRPDAREVFLELKNMYVEDGLIKKNDRIIPAVFVDDANQTHTPSRSNTPTPSLTPLLFDAPISHRSSNSLNESRGSSGRQSPNFLSPRGDQIATGSPRSLTKNASTLFNKLKSLTQISPRSRSNEKMASHASPSPSPVHASPLTGSYLSVAPSPLNSESPLSLSSPSVGTPNAGRQNPKLTALHDAKFNVKSLIDAGKTMQDEKKEVMPVEKASNPNPS